MPEKPTDVSLAVKHLCRAEASGALDSIECPSCHHQSVSIWFTHPKKNQYRTWFVCTDCSFQAHAINQGRPTNFSEDRVNERLQERDQEVLEKMRFPWPDEE